MKTLKTLPVALGFALALTLTSNLKAGEPTGSPKALALRHDLRKVPPSASDANLSSTHYLGAAAKLELNRAKVSTGGRVTPNRVSGYYLGASLKNPSSHATTFDAAPAAGREKK